MGPERWGPRGGAWLLPLMETEPLALPLPFSSSGLPEHWLLLNPLGAMGAGEGKGVVIIWKGRGPSATSTWCKGSTLGTLHCSLRLPDNRQTASRTRNTQRGEATSPGSHSQEVEGLEFKPRVVPQHCTVSKYTCPRYSWKYTLPAHLTLVKV